MTSGSPDAPDGELRYDALTGEWVNIVGHRQARPNLPTDACPFCVGGLEAPRPYDVRWFANRWPALAPGPPPDLRIDALGATNGAQPAIGACEVVLFSPEHDQSLASLPPEQVRKVVDLWAARTEALLARPEIEYVLVFENRGREVGATIDHPHGQIYGYPFVPPAPASEVHDADSCAVCVEVEREVQAKERIVAEVGDWTAWVPFASGYAYGVRIAPALTSGRCPISIPPRAMISRDFSSTCSVATTGSGGRRAGYRFPYLLWFHQAPSGGDGRWHVHAHIAPPLRAPGVLRYVASGELGSGTLSNPVVPEDAARALRDA